MKRIKKSKNATVTLLLCSFSMFIVLMLSIVYATFSTNLTISEKGKIRSLPRGIYYYREKGADVGYFYTDGSLANAMTMSSKETGTTEKISTLNDFAKAINQKTNLYMVSTYKETLDYQMNVVFSNDIDIYGYNIDGKSSYEKDERSNEGTLGYLFHLSNNTGGSFVIDADDKSTVTIHSRDINSEETFDIFSSGVRINISNIDFKNESKETYSNIFSFDAARVAEVQNVDIDGNFRLLITYATMLDGIKIHNFDDSQITNKKNFIQQTSVEPGSIALSLYLSNLSVESENVNFSKDLIKLRYSSNITFCDSSAIDLCRKYKIENISSIAIDGTTADITVKDQDNISFLSELIKETGKNMFYIIGKVNLGTKDYPLSIGVDKYISIETERATSSGFSFEHLDENSKIYVESEDDETLNSGGSVIIAKASSSESAVIFSKCFCPKSDIYEIIVSGSDIMIRRRAAYYYRESGSDTGYFYADKDLSQIMTNSSGEKISTLKQFADALNGETNLYMVSTYIEDFTNSSASVNFSHNLNVYGYNINGKSSYEKINSDTLGYLFKIYKTKSNGTTYYINASSDVTLRFYSKDVNSEDVFDMFLSSNYQKILDLSGGKKEFINTIKTKYSNAIRGAFEFKNCDLYGNFYLTPRGGFHSYNGITFHDFDDTNVTNKRTEIISSGYSGLYIGDVKVEESTCTFSAKNFNFMSAVDSHFEIQHRNILDTVIKYGFKMTSDAEKNNVPSWGGIYGMDLTTGSPYYKSVTVADEVDLISKIISTSSDNRFTDGVYKIGSMEKPIVISKGKPIKIQSSMVKKEKDATTEKEIITDVSKVYIKSSVEPKEGEKVDIITRNWAGPSMSNIIDYFVCANDGCELVVNGDYIAVVKKTSSSGASTASVLNSQQKDNKSNKNDEETDDEESSTIESSGGDPPAD